MKTNRKDRFSWDDGNLQEVSNEGNVGTTDAKAMSSLNSTTGGALVKPPKFMGKTKLKRTDWSRFARPG